MESAASSVTKQWKWSKLTDRTQHRDSNQAVPKDRRYRDSEWLREKYVEQDKTVDEIANMCGVAASTISTWARKFGFGGRQRDYDLSDVDIPNQAPWKDGDLLRRLYTEKKMSTNDIAFELDCSATTVRNWLQSHGIDIRSLSEGAANSHGSLDKVNFATTTKGYENWAPGDHHVYVHRLQAVALWGLDAVSERHVHHKNEIRWDNRPGNLELVSNAEHQKQHRKVKGLQRLRIAELYEHGDCSSYTVADEVDVDVSPNTVMKIHREHYGSGQK